MPDPVKVGIAGAGSVAMGTAAVLHHHGHDPMLWSPSGQGTAALAGDGTLVAHGAIDTAFRPRLAAGAEELVRENEVLVLALPAYGHKTVMDAMAPHVRRDQPVIIS
ncbi:MAG: NAD(P)-binding domain-containing protein, partial [Thiotrichales bacterium]|nr:NAD(P)-binding domain-containing protein [Thiotrichales bacterium]